jgi:hypothetical protein
MHGPIQSRETVPLRFKNIGKGLTGQASGLWSPFQYCTFDSAEEDRSFGVGEEGQRALRTLLFSTNNMINIQYTVKKAIDFPIPNREVTNQILPGQE